MSSPEIDKKIISDLESKMQSVNFIETGQWVYFGINSNLDKNGKYDSLFQFKKGNWTYTLLSGDKMNIDWDVFQNEDVVFNIPRGWRIEATDKKLVALNGADEYFAILKKDSNDIDCFDPLIYLQEAYSYAQNDTTESLYDAKARLIETKSAKKMVVGDFYFKNSSDSWRAVTFYSEHQGYFYDITYRTRIDEASKNDFINAFFVDILNSLIIKKEKISPPVENIRDVLPIHLN